jgi:4-amino-4-deoxychorismate mutase
MTLPPPRELCALRDRIDSVDDRIVDLIAERLRIAHEVAACKRRYGIAARLPDRIQAVLDRCALAGAAHDLDPRYVRELWAVIIEETCRIEEEILKRSPAASIRGGG